MTSMSGFSRSVCLVDRAIASSEYLQMKQKGEWAGCDRILYFFHGGYTAILSHGIVKEKRVPPKEIDKAIKRRSLFERNPDKYTYRR